jgi:hypothetical protein
VATASKSYFVEDAEKQASPKGARTPFPYTLQGLLDALDAARYRSAAGTPKVVVIIEGKRRQIIRRFEGGSEAWSASRAEIRSERGKEPPSGGKPDLRAHPPCGGPLDSVRDGSHTSHVHQGSTLRGGGDPPAGAVAVAARHEHEVAVLGWPAEERAAHAPSEPPCLLGSAGHVAVLPGHPVLEHRHNFPDQGQPRMADQHGPRVRPEADRRASNRP